MKMKKLWGFLMILVVAIFTFTACSSSDDDDEKTGTFEYAITYSSFNGGKAAMEKVNTAFKEAFGVTSTPITLTGTRSECNRKAKEYAIKAQAALANEGSFGAVIEFINASTDEQILTFTIQKDENGAYSKDGFQYITKYSSIIFHSLKDKGVKIVRPGSKPVVVFDGVLTSNDQTIQIDRKTSGFKFIVVVEGFGDFSVILPKK